MKLRILLFTALLTAASGCHKFDDPVVATVDGMKITASELRTQMSMERGNFDPAILSEDANFAEFRRRALDKLIEERMLLAEAKRLGIEASRKEQKDMEELLAGALTASEGDAALRSQGVDPGSWREAQRRRLVIGKLISKEVLEKVPVTDGEVRAYYDSHVSEFNRPAQYRARQIIVDSRELADEILAKLKQGQDFGELAKQHSLSPDGKRGGDLGFFDARAYPAVFAEVCSQLKIGEISDVVPTDYGYQIFELLEKRPARQIPYEEAAVQIRRRLREEGSEKIFAEWSEGIRAKSKASVDEEALKGVSLEKKN